MLGTIIEQNGDGLLEQSHMPVGWPLHIDGAVRQNCAHRGTTLQELDNLLGEYDLNRDLVEINRKAPQWSHNAVWNKKYMEPRPGFTLQQLCDIRRAVTALQQCPLLHCPIVHSSRHWEPSGPNGPTTNWITGTTSYRRVGRNLCENKAVSILEQMQAGRPALIKKDGGEMLIAIVLDRPLAEAKALVEAPMPSSKPSLGSCKTNRTTQSLRK